MTDFKTRLSPMTGFRYIVYSKGHSDEIRVGGFYQNEAGRIAYDIFVSGLVAAGHTLYDINERRFIVGDAGQLDTPAQSG
jgi:hypothetical protein